MHFGFAVPHRIPAWIFTIVIGIGILGIELFPVRRNIKTDTVDLVIISIKDNAYKIVHTHFVTSYQFFGNAVPGTFITITANVNRSIIVKDIYNGAVGGIFNFSWRRTPF